MSLFTVLIACEQEKEGRVVSSLPWLACIWQEDRSAGKAMPLGDHPVQPVSLGDPSCSVITMLSSPCWRLNRLEWATGGGIFPGGSSSGEEPSLPVQET